MNANIYHKVIAASSAKGYAVGGGLFGTRAKRKTKAKKAPRKVEHFKLRLALLDFEYRIGVWSVYTCRDVNSPAYGDTVVHETVADKWAVLGRIQSDALEASQKRASEIEEIVKGTPSNAKLLVG